MHQCHLLFSAIPNSAAGAKPIPPRPPLAVSVPEFSRPLGGSDQTTRRKIKAGKIRAIQLAPGEPYKIPTSEGSASSRARAN
jgi:hypothetical protein